MSAYDDQYDAPLNGPERARIEALKLASTRMHDTTEKWVEDAGLIERFIIGSRATEVQKLIDAAFDIADRLLQDGDRAVGRTDAWAGVPDVIPIDAARLRDLVGKLSVLAGGPPF